MRRKRRNVPSPNPSQAIKGRSVELLHEERRRRWLTENAAAIADYNDRVERDGTFSDGVRRF
jgi:antitoxin CcdA